MPVNESSLRVYLMRRCHSKVIHQKMRVFFKYWKRLLVKKLLVKKSERITFNSASTTNQTNIC